MAFISIRDLRKYFPVRGIGNRHTAVRAVDGVSLEIDGGTVLGLVGESGSGKTTLANCLAGFLEPTSGEILIDGKRMRSHRSHFWARDGGRRFQARRIQMVFQDPVSALNPRQRVGAMLSEPLLAHGLGDRRSAGMRAAEIAELVGIGLPQLERYPHELNSGQRQRLVIARALTLEPRVLICDEPVSKLDVSTQSQILNVLSDLHDRLKLTMVFITHDLSVVRQVADRVAVMYLGKVMEVTDADDFFAQATHPYSAALMASTPRFDTSEVGNQRIQGEIPSPVNPPSGCVFHTRCREAIDTCRETPPPLHEVGRDHYVACVRR